VPDFQANLTEAGKFLIFDSVTQSTPGMAASRDRRGNFRVPPELITGCELLSPAVAESLNRDIEANLVSVLETVRYRFGGL